MSICAHTHISLSNTDEICCNRFQVQTYQQSESTERPHQPHMHGIERPLQNSHKKREQTTNITHQLPGYHTCWHSNQWSSASPSLCEKYSTNKVRLIPVLCKNLTMWCLQRCDQSFSSLRLWTDLTDIKTDLIKGKNIHWTVLAKCACFFFWPLIFIITECGCKYAHTPHRSVAFTALSLLVKDKVTGKKLFMRFCVYIVILTFQESKYSFCKKIHQNVANQKKTVKGTVPHFLSSRAQKRI